MCYALFLGSDDILEIEDAIAGEDRFHLEVIQPEHEIVRAKFSKPNIYYAASWQGCGCGWRGGGLHLSRKRRKESSEKAAESVRQLAQLLSSLLDRGRSVELLLGWEGELEQDPQGTVRLELRDFADVLPLDDGEFAVIGEPQDDATS